MYSSEDLERFYFQYQTEALPHGESLQSFCVKNKVPYNIFQKWFKDTWKKVVDHYKKCYIWVLVNKARKTAIFFYENGSCGRDVLTDFWGDAELKSIMMMVNYR